jgi:hypothetical protein
MGAGGGARKSGGGSLKAATTTTKRAPFFMQPPPSTLVFSARSSSVQTLDEFLMSGDNNDSHDGNSIDPASASWKQPSPSPTNNKDRLGNNNNSSTNSKPLAKRVVKERERVRTFVSATWENILMVRLFHIYLLTNGRDFSFSGRLL